MEASAGLVAGSHNRNELVVIHNHEEVLNTTTKLTHFSHSLINSATNVFIILLSCFVIIVIFIKLEYL